MIPIFGRTPRSWGDGPIPAPKANDVALGYLDAFDPDILVQFASEIPSGLANCGIRIIQPQDIWRSFNEEQDRTPNFGIGVFELLKEIYEQEFKFRPRYPKKTIFPEFGGSMSLFWASFFGEMPVAILRALRAEYFAHLDAESPSFEIEQLKSLVAPDVIFPRRIIMHKLETAGEPRPRIFYMDAQDTGDIVDYWNLRALGGQVLPFPRQLRTSPEAKDLAVEFLKHHRRHWRHNLKHCDFACFIKSRSSNMDEMTAFARSLDVNSEANDPSDDPFFSLQRWYPRIWDEWARDYDQAASQTLEYEEKSIDVAETESFELLLKSTLPDFVDKFGYSGEPRCANELNFRFYGSNVHLAEVLPKNNGNNFIRSIASIASFREDWRVGRNGLVRLVKHNHVDHWSIPKAEDTFFAWLKDLNWEPKLSSPGMLAREIYRRLGGHLAALREEKLLGLLERMNGGSVSSDDTPKETKDGKLIEERAVPIGEIKNRLRTISPDRDLHDYLVAKGVFRIGLRVSCPNCMRKFWSPIEDLSSSLSCPKCLNSLPAVGNVDGGDWCYKTAGPFSVPRYADGAYGVLLSLDFFNETRNSGVRLSPTFSFEARGRDGNELEADFGAFWTDRQFGRSRHGVIFGECKTYSAFVQRDFERMGAIAQEFPGAVIAFCTLRRKLHPKEVLQIKRIAKTGRKHWKTERPINPVLVLTGTELLSDYGAPNCWEEAYGKKFKNIRGLLELCDASQQIHLGLPSWHIAWRQKWKRRRARKNSSGAAV